MAPRAASLPPPMAPQGQQCAPASASGPRGPKATSMMDSPTSHRGTLPDRCPTLAPFPVHLSRLSHHHHLHGLRVSSHRRQSPRRPRTWSASRTGGLQPQAPSGKWPPPHTHSPLNPAPAAPPCGEPLPEPSQGHISLGDSLCPGHLDHHSHNPDTGHPVIGPTPSSRKGK